MPKGVPQGVLAEGQEGMRVAVALTACIFFSSCDPVVGSPVGVEGTALSGARRHKEAGVGGRRWHLCAAAAAAAPGGVPAFGSPAQTEQGPSPAARPGTRKVQT